MSKSPSVVVQPNEGKSYWSPKPSNSYVEIKISPWNLPDTQHTVFLDELPPGCYVGEHSHEGDAVEIFTILSGNGEMTLDGEVFNIEPETVIYVHNESRHSIRNTGTNPLRFMVVMSPTGLEERFKAMGPEKNHTENPPEPFTSYQRTDSHGVKGRRSN